VKKERNDRRKVAEKVVLLPEGGPRQIEEQRAHLEAKNNDDGTKEFIHEKRFSAGRGNRELTGRLLKRGNALRNVTIVDVDGVDLGETLQGGIRITGRFLRHP
jgi:hypothetical protein